MNYSNLSSDAENSTYHHIAYFLTGYKEHGWSKKKERAESTNKIALLCGAIGRLVPKYLGNHPKGMCLKVEFYKRNVAHQGINPIVREELIAMFDDAGYELKGAFEKDPLLRNFVSAFYEANLDFERVKPMIKKFGAHNPYQFDPSRESFEDLRVKCGLLRDQGYPYGEVEHFFLAIKRRFFERAPTNQLPTAPTIPIGGHKQRGSEASAIGSLIGAQFNNK